MARNNDVENSLNIISSGTSVKGTLSSDGDIRIDGMIGGSVSSKGKIVIGSSGCVEGEMQCQNAEIAGSVNATLKVSDLLTLKSTAKLYGDTVTNKLAIEPGAIFTGKCTMDDHLNRETRNGKNSGLPETQEFQLEEETA